MMATVAAAQLVVVGELVIQFDIELPLWVGAKNDFTPVGIRERRALYVGHGIKIQDCLSDGIDLTRRDRVVVKSSVRTRRGRALVSRARIKDSVWIGRIIRKVTATLRRC